MTERTITALFTDDTEAHRAAEAIRALGVHEDRVALVSRASLAAGHFGPGGNASEVGPPPGSGLGAGSAPAGTLLVIRAGAEEEGKLIVILEHHQPDQITSEGAEYHSAGWTRFDEAAGSFGAVEISDDRLGTAPVPPPESGTGLSQGAGRIRSADAGADAGADAAPKPGSAGGGPQAHLDRTRRSVLGTPDPALDRAPEPAPNTPAGKRRTQGRQTRAERNSDRQNG